MKSQQNRIHSPRVSCVIPTYNRADLVFRAIESVLSQNEPVEEIVVVDDGSTDETRSVLSKLPVTYVYQENSGGATARNKGVSVATNHWIAFLDSDDIWTTGHIERMKSALVQTHFRGDIYFSDVELDTSGSRSRLWARANFQPDQDVQLIADGTGWAFLKQQPMMLQGTVARKSAIMASRGFADGLVRRHDTHFFFSMCIGRPVCAVRGIGAVMSNDDGTGRLTSSFHSKSLVYHQSSISVYRDALQLLMARYDRPPRPYEVEAKSRLSNAHRQLASVLMKRGSRLASLRSLMRALRMSPRQVASSVFRRTMSTLTHNTGPTRRKVDP